MDYKNASINFFLKSFFIAFSDISKVTKSEVKIKIIIRFTLIILLGIAGIIALTYLLR